jgi:transposase
MMAHISGQSRHQVTLFPEVLDEVVGPNDPVRVIDAFVDRLDLEALGFRRVVAEEMGRPSYAPGDLLKLYIYGYLHRVRASRRLEAETHRNVQVMWLLNRLTPAFKTICRFPQGSCGSDRWGVSGLYPLLPGAVAVWRRAAGD